MTRSPLLRALLATTILVAAASCTTAELTQRNFECTTSQDCRPTDDCHAGKCVLSDKDGDGWSKDKDCDDQSSLVYPGAPEVCLNKADDNCNGKVDEEPCACLNGTFRPCGESRGTCRPGRQMCVRGKWSSSCEGGILPKEEICDGLDNDCDGEADEKITIPCYTGPPETKGIGRCRDGIKRCAGGSFGACEKQELPTAEVCNGQDDDCDGLVDNATRSKPELLSTVCYDGAQGTKGVGPCVGGKARCIGGKWEPCRGQVVPVLELCDLKDNDCDGKVDEELVRLCYKGPAGSAGKGICIQGRQRCSTGTWGECTGSVLPKPEICDSQDNDCNGKVDDGISRPCYSGPKGTVGIGHCRAGLETCLTGKWGQCSGQVLPATELCNGRDDNCDGKVDEPFPVGTRCSVGTGSCRRIGTWICAANGKAVCDEKPGNPSPEVCDGADNDCDGALDEGLTKKCTYSGNPATRGIGPCKEGKRICIKGTWSTECKEEILPEKEICADNIDNDCNGVVDDSAACVGCADGSREGLDQKVYPFVAACFGKWTGTIGGASSQALCAKGWHVCTHQSKAIRKVEFGHALGVVGCNAYNAANDFDLCVACTGGNDNNDLAGLGPDCGWKNNKGGGGCIKSGRIDVKGPDSGCKHLPHITGVVCCRI